MNILVTGCLGTVGLSTIDFLLKNSEHCVIGMDNCSTNPIERLSSIDYSNSRFRFYNNSVCSVDDVFKDGSIDVVLHLASLVGNSESMKKPVSYVDNNITFTALLLEKSREYGVRRFVFSSSSAVYGRNSKLYNTENDPVSPTSVYGITKKTCEDLIQLYNCNYSIETIVLRYYNIFANMKFYHYKPIIPLLTEKILFNQDIILFNNGKQRRQYVPIQNIIHANKLAIETKDPRCVGQTFNITVDEEPISLLSLVNYIASKLNKNINYKLNSFVEPGDTEVVSGSNKKAKQLLKFQIQKSMYDGIDEYIEWLITHEKEIFNDS